VATVEGTTVPLLPTDADSTANAFFLDGASPEKTGFNESAYLAQNPDVAEAVQANIFPSGLEHYVQFGQTEGRPAWFTGSDQSDTITAFGQATNITGVSGNVIDDDAFSATSLGTDERDTLVGGPGTDRFVLGGFNPNLQKSEVFYLGSGQARIENFDQTKDRLVLAGQPQDYSISFIFLGVNPGTSGTLIVHLATNDAIAFIPDVSSLATTNLEFIG
jgi:hypothetical protein